MIGDQDRFDALVELLAGEPVFALDFEFHRERTYFPQVALVQVAWPGGVAVVDPLATDIGGISRVLEAGGTAVLHAASQDLEILDHLCARRPARLFDTQVAAGFLGYSAPALGSLLRSVLGVKLPKGDRLTDWSRRPLTDDQLAYAASDVSHLLDLRSALVRDLEERGRLAWAEQECQEMLERPRPRAEPAESWWRLKESKRLQGESRGVAQAVAEWREREAMARDVPVRFVLSDMAITALAYRPPKRAADLSHVRGLDNRYLRGAPAQALLEAVQRGVRLAPADLRTPPGEEPDPALRATVTLVAAWVSQRARDLKLDPGLVANRADVEGLLGGNGQGRLLHGWRHDLVGEPARRLAAGDASLAVERGGRLVLEERSHRSISAPDAGTEPV